jgi:NADPH:quinone reductase-like Zn-dependent oxidoreductase
VAGPVRPREAGPGADGGHPRRGRRGRVDGGPAGPLGRRRGDRDRARPFRQLVKELGADRFIALDEDRLEDAAGIADVVFDLVGGDVLARSSVLLKPGGTLVSVVSWELPADRDDIKKVFFIQEAKQVQLTELARLVDAGHLRPQVGGVYPLAQAVEAYRAKAAGGIPGRMVLQP